MDKLKEFGLKLESMVKEYNEMLSAMSEGHPLANEPVADTEKDSEPSADGSRGVVNTAAE